MQKKTLLNFQILTENGEESTRDLDVWNLLISILQSKNFLLTLFSDLQIIRQTEPPILGLNYDKDPGAKFTMLGWILAENSWSVVQIILRKTFIWIQGRMGMKRYFPKKSLVYQIKRNWKEVIVKTLLLVKTTR